MEAERYRDVCAWVDQVSPHGRQDGEQFADATVAKVYLYAVLIDRPVSFVCVRTNWDQTLLDRQVGRLPSQPTMSRRLRTVGVLAILERVLVRLGEEHGDAFVKAIDSKPLRVGNYSKDSEARRGRAAGEMARGYKLHAICRGNRFIRWAIAAMNTNDQTMAALLIAGLGGYGYVVGDNGYDANPMHLLLRAQNHRLIAPPRRSSRDVRDPRRNTPERLRTMDMVDDRLYHGDSFGRSLMNQRRQIERQFGHAVMLGMHAPPPWVRGPRRVALWVAGKLILSTLRLRQLEQQRLTA